MTIAEIGTKSKEVFENPFRSVLPPFPVDFAIALRDICHVQTFIETGTYKGDTAVAVAPLFNLVYTIEGVKARYKLANGRKDLPKNVRVLFGASHTKLKYALKQVGDEPCLIYHDAHWTHCGYPIEDDPLQEPLHPCPLLQELDVIDMSVPHVILIDDVHFFTHPPKGRGPVEAWPSLEQIVCRLTDRFVFINSGQLVGVPVRYRKEMENWLLDHWTTWRQFG